jgi:hypothetical protein
MACRKNYYLLKKKEHEFNELFQSVSSLSESANIIENCEQKDILEDNNFHSSSSEFELTKVTSRKVDAVFDASSVIDLAPDNQESDLYSDAVSVVANSSITDLETGNSEAASDVDKQLMQELKDWYNSTNSSLHSFKKLLGILKKYHNIPGDPRTILGTKTHEETPVLEGSFVYFGLEKNIRSNFNLESAEIDELQLDVSIDGVPIYKSVGTSFWPILCSTSNSIHYQAGSANPFVVGIYCGKKKPEIHSYLKDFCLELKQLLNNGIFIKNKCYSVKVRAIIADAPAKALIKQIKSHGGYFACDRCVVKGHYDINVKSVSYNETNTDKRTDASFRNKLQPEHHIGDSPFIDTNIDMINTFAIDYMHIILLGIMKKLLKSWLQIVPFKLSTGQKANVELTINSIKTYIPCEFNRKPRSLSEMDRYKATEFRLILLYTGVAYFKDVLKENMFKNFLLLMYIVRTLCNPNAVADSDILTHIEKLCLIYVKQFKKFYGNKFALSLNIHVLIHVVDDVRRFGVLDSFGAFPFENMLGRIKKRVRSSNLPLSQITRRISEGMTFAVDREIIHSGVVSDKFLYVNECKITPKSFKNSCVILHDTSIALIEGINANGRVHIKQFVRKIPAFDYPYTSDNIDVYLVDKKIREKEVSQMEIHKKCMIYPFKKKFLVLTLL